MLRSRERTTLVLGALAAAAILLVSYVVIPGATRLKNLTRAYAQAEKDLADLRKMRPELEAADREVRRKGGRVASTANSQESPLARLTAVLRETGFPQSSFSVKSAGAKDGEFQREEAFDLKIENITYLEAIRLAARLENGPLPVTIRAAQMKGRYDDNRYLDATFRIGFLQPKER